MSTSTRYSIKCQHCDRRTQNATREGDDIVVCDLCGGRSRKFVFFSPCSMCGGSGKKSGSFFDRCERCKGVGDLPEIESYLKGEAAAVRGGCPVCSRGPGLRHDGDCPRSREGTVPALTEQEHQPEYARRVAFFPGEKGRYQPPLPPSNSRQPARARTSLEKARLHKYKKKTTKNTRKR